MNEEMRKMGDYISRVAGGFIKSTTPLQVIWMENSETLGYTQKHPYSIHIMWTSPVFKGLSPKELQACRIGLAAHECMHQLLTDFDIRNEQAKKYPGAMGKVYGAVTNIIEDAGIEYYAPNFIGGVFMQGILYVNEVLYKRASELSKSMLPLSQILSAMTTYGYVGLVKGEFTYSAAKEAFKKIVPIFDRLYKLPNSVDRITGCAEIMDLLKPFLTEKEAEMLPDPSMENGRPRLSDDEVKACLMMGAEGSKSVEDRRKKTGKSLNGKDIKAKADIPGGEKSEESMSDTSDKGSGADDNTSSIAGADSSKPGEDCEGECPDMDLKEMSDMISNKVKEEMSKSEKAERKEHKGEYPDEIPQLDWTGSNDFMRWATHKDINLSVSVNTKSRENYRQILSESDVTWAIKKLTKDLKEILESKEDDSKMSTSGTYNVYRGAIGTTARIFDRNRNKSDKKDQAVMLLIDMSGSMYGEKIRSAEKAAAIIAESLYNVKIPFYVMGFTDNGCDVLHYHLATWNNPASRVNIGGMEYCELLDNTDGYSIRTAAAMLAMRPEKNKRMIIISDGQPCTSIYPRYVRVREVRHGYNFANDDTALAIKESKKMVDLTGIAVDCPNAKLLQRFYGRDFIYTSKPEELPRLVGSKLKDAIRK